MVDLKNVNLVFPINQLQSIQSLISFVCPLKSQLKHMHIISILVQKLQVTLILLEKVCHTFLLKIRNCIHGFQNFYQGCKQLGQSLWCQNNLFLRFLLLNKLNRTAFLGPVDCRISVQF